MSPSMFRSSALLLSLLAASLSFSDAATSAPFSYDPEDPNGPQNWHTLPMSNNQCAGKKNSPIPIESRGCDRYDDYEFKNGDCRYDNMQYSLTNTGVKASFPSDEDACDRPTVNIPGIKGTFEALQFHIHTSSEHTIDGEFFGAELHTVHKDLAGDRFAVVGTLIQPSAAKSNMFFEELLLGWEYMSDNNNVMCGQPPAAKTHRGLGNGKNELIFSPYNMLADDVAFYHYDGGLTTPPCSEVVWWNLADKPLPISANQYMRLVDLVTGFLDPTTCKLGSNAGPAGSTSRPVQPIYGRTVERVCPTNMMHEN